MSVRALTQRVTIAGVETKALTIGTDHGTDKPIGTGSITITAPRPTHVELGAPIKIEVGYDGDVDTIFDGKIANDEATFSESGGNVRVAIEGHGKLLWFANPSVQSIAGPVALHSVFTSFCTARGIPYHLADMATTPANVAIMVGGNAKIDDGKIMVDSTESPGTVIDRLARLFGYRIFDTPDGTHRFKKISGLPTAEPVRVFTEGVNILNVRQGRTLAGMVNYWEILGAAYTAVDGSSVAIRSIPASYTPDPRLGPSGVSHKELKDEALVTQGLADACRNVQEIDFSTPQVRWSWTGTGDGTLSPGQAVTVNSPAVGGELDCWLTSVAHTISGQGWTTSMEGWAGAGEALPAGDDCVTQLLLGSAGKHLGNEYLAHYKRPNPDGLSISIPFTLVDGYNSATSTCKAHSTNSFVGNATSTASRFEIWQGGTKKSEGVLPRQNENLDRRFPYSQDQYWSAATIPLSGSLVAGSSILKIISGYDNNIGDYDDFEVKDIDLRTCGVGEPVIIGTEG